jgi:hypothetical protein
MMGEWQPIETAPKDGTAFLAFGLGPKQVDASSIDTREKLVPGCRVMYWFEGWDSEALVEESPGLFRKVPTKTGARLRGSSDWLFQPSHWMPLPDPPAEAEARG